MGEQGPAGGAEEEAAAEGVRAGEYGGGGGARAVAGVRADGGRHGAELGGEGVCLRARVVCGPECMEMGWDGIRGRRGLRHDLTAT